MPKEARPAADVAESNTQNKKRRVAKTAVSNNEGSINKVAEVSVYGSVVEHEERESTERDADEDAALYYKTCREVQRLLLEIAEHKIHPKDDSEIFITQKRIQVTLKIIILKKLNRLEKFRTKQSRDALQKAREQVDSDHLHLQNLVYEALHLLKEVQKCLEFRSKDEEMELVTVEEFYQNAPESISKPDITSKDPHELKLARLHWELQQRKELAAECKHLEAKKEGVAKEIEKRKVQLSSLLPSVRNILEMTKPLQEYLGIFIDKTIKLHELACLLPKALYVIFVQSDAFSKVVNWVSVNIIGECDKTHMEESSLDDISSADSDSENEADTSHRRKTAFQDRRSSKVGALPDRLEQRKKECFKKHPLSVVVKLTLKTGEILSIEFQWLVQLEIICVLPSLSLNTTRGIAGGDLLSSKVILSSLFRGDVGESSPNPTTHYHFHRAGIDSFPTNIPNLGVPYKWAQAIAGINLLSCTDVQVEIRPNNIERILKSIRVRCYNRLALAKELYNFEKGNWDHPPKITTILGNFFSVTYDDFEKVASYQNLRQEGQIDNSCSFYKATIHSNLAKVIAYIIVSPNYPKHAPIFLLEMTYKGTHTALTSEGIRDIEREVNIHLDFEDNHQTTKGLLTWQMTKLLYCIEVYIQTEFPKDFPVHSTFFRGVQGRNRSHPYRYTLAAGGLYTHR